LISLGDARVTKPLNGKTVIHATMGWFLPRHIVTIVASVRVSGHSLQSSRKSLTQKRTTRLSNG